MVSQRIIIFFLFAIVTFQASAFAQGEEETIRAIFEKTTGCKTFSLDIAPIKEGMTNKNFKVLMNGTPYFVRLGHKDPQSLRIDRVKERSLYRLVEKDGIAPRLLYSDTGTGNLVAPFIQGTPYGKKGGKWLYERSESIKQIVALLRRYHAHPAPKCPVVDYPFKIIDDYIQQAQVASIPLPKDIDRVIAIVQALKRRIPQQKKVLCHQDLVPDNFIFDGKKLYLVDWEYAEWSNPFYDLAALCTEHQFDEEEKRMLLQNYFQSPGEEQRIVLEMMCMLYSLRDCLWYILENNRSAHHACDFIGLAREHYQNFFASMRWLEVHQVRLEQS